MSSSYLYTFSTLLLAGLLTAQSVSGMQQCLEEGEPSNTPRIIPPETGPIDTEEPQET